MTIVARTFSSIPKRSAVDTWSAIVKLLAPKASSAARKELESVAGIASSLITELAFDATDGDWVMSLPCPPDDLSWVSNSLARKSKRITARDRAEPYDSEDNATSQAQSSKAASLNMEAFLKP